MLEREIAAFDAALPALLRDHEGEFVVVLGDRVLGTFPTLDAALDWAYEALGLQQFLLRRVLAQQPRVSFSGFWLAR
jgi:class 3 adenylate cyclase